MYLRLFCILMLLSFAAWSGMALAQVPGGGEETMLMFVGESQPVVTVASRTPESPAVAPAIVSVISRAEIEQRGWRTLAELLADQPGFFIATSGRGPIPYLRGIRDGILFLYDGVPISTDITKGFAPLGREIALAGVEQVEIVRGAGSVLWGADAFAGVVNLVPRQHRPGSRGQLSLLSGGQQTRSGDLFWSGSSPLFDYSLFFAASREQFHAADMLSSDSNYQSSDSSFRELACSLNVGRWLRLSGRWSDNQRHYAMQDGSGSIRWPGIKEAPFNYLKAILAHESGASHFQLSTFIQQINYRLLDAGVERQQRNRLYQAELLWDRRVLSRGLYTLGASLRSNNVHGAVVRDAFLPGFVGPEEKLFVPNITQRDFSNRYRSLFSQFRYQWGNAQWWAGLRFDDHNAYDSTISYSLGFASPLSRTFNVKAVFGNAYRTPYARQLFDGGELTPEQVQTAALQFNWQDQWHQGRVATIELTLFYSRLHEYRYEDPYGGLSAPTSSKVYGGELAARAELTASLDLHTGLMLTSGSDGSARYRVLDYSFVRADGTRVDVFDNWQEPFDSGPDWLLQAGLQWRFRSAHQLALSGRIGGDYAYSYGKGEPQGTYSHPLLLDLGYRYQGFLAEKSSLHLRVTNLLNRDYHQADIYGPVEGPPLQVTLMWELLL